MSGTGDANQTMVTVIAVVSFFTPIVLGLLRLLDAQREKEKERRLSVLEKGGESYDAKCHALDGRIHVYEIETVKIRGEISQLQSHQQYLRNDIEEYKKHGVSRQEWELAIKDINRRLEELLERLNQALPGRFKPSDSVSSMAAVKPR